MSHSSLGKQWLPARFTIGDDGDLDEANPFVVIISNQPLENKGLLLSLCRRALLVVCADGGANRLKDLALTEREEQECGLSMICGDMDSVRPEVLECYREKGVRIFKDTDQDSTDLMKCMKSIANREELGTANGSRMWNVPDPYHQRVHIALLGGLGGRADQAFSQLHHLYVTTTQSPHLWARDVYLITSESVIFVLEKGLNKINAPVKPMMFTENAGIIPIGRPSVITTRGLEWDVTDWPTEFGGQMSTSNHIKAEVIEVESTERVLLTLEYNQIVSTSGSRQD